jgi:serine/threonine-protein kinase RsbW
MMDAESKGDWMPQRRRPAGSPEAATFTRVAAALDAFCAAEGVPPSVAWRLRVALDEVLANVLSHGGTGGRLPTLEVSLRRDADRVEIVVTDDGPAFDPLASPAPDVTLPLEARQPGGLGIALVRALIDEVHYERRDGNVLTLRARLGAAPAEPGVE